jgi:hypothetical protein
MMVHTLFALNIVAMLNTALLFWFKKTDRPFLSFATMERLDSVRAVPAWFCTIPQLWFRSG